jgi:hypothetical protein
MQRSAIPARRSATREQLARRQPEEIEEDDSYYSQRMPSSAIRYTDTQGNRVIQRGRQRIIIHDEPPPRKVHWMLILGVGMIFMLALFAGASWVSNWWTNHQQDTTYGFPRTYQVDAVVGHNNDSPVNPSHFIFLNLNGHIEIIELPAGDAGKAKIYIGPTLFSDNAAFIPVTGEFRNMDGKEEMLVHIQDQTITYVSDGTMFKLKQ